MRESYGECEEMKEIKRMKKKKEMVNNRWENKEEGTHLMAKLHVV